MSSSHSFEQWFILTLAFFDFASSSSDEQIIFSVDVMMYFLGIVKWSEFCALCVYVW